MKRGTPALFFVFLYFSIILISPTILRQASAAWSLPAEGSSQGLEIPTPITADLLKVQWSSNPIYLKLNYKDSLSNVNEEMTIDLKTPKILYFYEEPASGEIHRQYKISFRDHVLYIFPLSSKELTLQVAEADNHLGERNSFSETITAEEVRVFLPGDVQLQILDTMPNQAGVQRGLVTENEMVIQCLQALRVFLQP
jgi:hypothetical protein